MEVNSALDWTPSDYYYFWSFKTEAKAGEVVWEKERQAPSKVSHLTVQQHPTSDWQQT